LSGGALYFCSMKASCGDGAGRISGPRRPLLATRSARSRPRRPRASAPALALRSGAAAGGVQDPLDDLIQAEAGRLLPWRELKVARNSPTKSLRGHQQEDVAEHPVAEGVRGLLCALVRVHAQIEDVRRAQPDERLLPNLQRALDTLLHEQHLPVVVAQRRDVAVVGEVDETLAQALRFLAGEGRGMQPASIGRLDAGVLVDTPRCA